MIRRCQKVKKFVGNKFLTKSEVVQICDLFAGLKKGSILIFTKANENFLNDLKASGRINPDFNGIPCRYVWRELNFYGVDEEEVKKVISQNLIEQGEQA